MVLANPQNKVWTYEDLLTLPDDGKRYEIIAGELLELPAPSRLHQIFIGLLVTILSQHVRIHKLGWILPAPTDVQLDPHFVFQPDVVFIRSEEPTWSSAAEGNSGESKPSLVVEVLSPSTQRNDRVRKFVYYAHFGIPEYWIIDLDAQSILVQVLRNGSYVPFEQQGDGLIRSEVLPGLEVDLKDLFS
jgi:Uma2 family endonuclease